MKKFKIIVFALVLVAVLAAVAITLALPSSAETEGYYTYTVSNGKATITGIDKTISGEVIIPNKIGGYPVTRIGNGVFRNCTSITSVTIPNSVYIIDLGNGGMFSNCTSLTSITVEEGNTTYHSSGNCIISVQTLVAGCKNSIIPTDGSVKIIAPWAFSGCTNLMSITIPDSVTSICDGAFSGCTSLTSVTIPDGVTSISRFAFESCTSLTSITISDSVTSIDDYAFGGCTSLEHITVEQGNTVYHSNGNCLIETAIKSLIVGCKNSIIPMDGSVTSIAFSAFINCTGLESITIPYSVTSIGSFRDCTSLTSITITDSVTSIVDNAFERCENVTIYCYEDSYAHTYAQNHSIDFVLIYYKNKEIPLAPTVQSITENSVTLTPISGYEYKIEGGEWQSSNIFKELLPNTSYVFYQRIAETDIISASVDSQSISVTTNDHDFSINENDADNHWHKCANCDAIDTKEAHSFGKNKKCTVCDYKVKNNNGNHGEGNNGNGNQENNGNGYGNKKDNVEETTADTAIEVSDETMPDISSVISELGCGSTVGGSLALVATLGFAAAFIGRKKKSDE